MRNIEMMEKVEYGDRKLQRDLNSLLKELVRKSKWNVGGSQRCCYVKWGKMCCKMLRNNERRQLVG